MPKGKSKGMDEKALLESLEIDEEALDAAESLSMEQMSVAHSLLKLAGISAEKEYQLCRSLAEKLLGAVPEPEEIDLD